MGLSPRQVHFGFSVTKEMTVERSWGERVIHNFIPTVAGQSLKSHPLRVSLHTASQSLPLGLWVSALGTATTPASALLSCNLAATPPCHPEHWAKIFIANQ